MTTPSIVLSAAREGRHALWLSAFLVVTSGCVSAPASRETGRSPDVPVTQAVLPTVVQPYQRIDSALQCIHATGVLDGRTFVVGPFADSTGKINSVSQGATGAFVPQGGSAAYITDALSKAGGRVISTYFGSPAITSPAQYMVNGIFNSLDFGTSVTADIQVAGVGPVAQVGWAQLTLSIQLDEAGTRLNRQISMIQRPVRFTSFGPTIGAVWGNTLVTGSFAVQNQERLQFEALNGPIALGIIDVLVKEFPEAGTSCGSMVADLLAPAGAAGAPAAQPAPTGATPRGGRQMVKTASFN
jgi:hypothetical protein